jgi:prepilin signal peptidase PulO-like enzyme (type II secretory pathway)
MIIPNKIVLPAAVVGLAASIALNPGRWWIYLVAAVGASLFLFILALIWPGGMGGGDIKLALFMGGVLGTMVIAAMFLAFLFGAVVGLILIASKLKSRKDHIPFGPYLALGSILAVLYGAWLVDAYLSLLG